MIVLFVGQNPSRANLDPNVPFLGTRSNKVLQTWIKFLEIENYTSVNASNKIGKVTAKDMDIGRVYYNYNFWRHQEYVKVIALGSYAAKACENADIPYFKLSHPSPKNRNLNNKQHVLKILEECKKWLNR